MNEQGETVAVDLAFVRSKDQLFHLLGSTFEFGGPEGNVRVELEAHRGWGKNWDALVDSFRYLDSGGIWGTRRRFRFPLLLRFLACSGYERADPKEFDILKDILEETQQHYAKRAWGFGMNFNREVGCPITRSRRLAKTLAPERRR